jgi:hypothetical protein
MLRVLAVSAVGAWSLATSAAACTMIVDKRPAETLEQWALRKDTEDQANRWRKADAVFLAEVISLRLIGDDRIDARLRKVATIKGTVGPGQIFDTYDPQFGNTCGRTLYPEIGQTAVFYTRRLPWWQRWLRWGRPDVESAILLNLVVEPRTSARVRTATDGMYLRLR